MTSFHEQNGEACSYYLDEESLGLEKVLKCSLEKAINEGLALWNKEYANILCQLENSPKKLFYHIPKCYSLVLNVIKQIISMTRNFYINW